MVNSIEKHAFHKSTYTALKKLAISLKIDDYDVRSNRGGSAVWGEVILHTPKVYVCVSKRDYAQDFSYLRSCKGMSDYVGGRNIQTSLDSGKLAQRVAEVTLA